LKHRGLSIEVTTIEQDKIEFAVVIPRRTDS